MASTAKTGVGVNMKSSNGTTLTNTEIWALSCNPLPWCVVGLKRVISLSRTCPSPAANSERAHRLPCTGQDGLLRENEPNYKYFDFNKRRQASPPTAQAKGYEMTGDTAGKWQGFWALTQWNFMVFNVNAPQPENAGIPFFNWLSSSQDNIDLWLMGVDGVNFKSEANLGFSEIAGTDAARNYRRQLTSLAWAAASSANPPICAPPRTAKMP